MKISPIILVLVSTTIAQNDCSSGIQGLLAPLKNQPVVQSFCSSKYPIKTPTSTTTSIIVSTVTPAPVTVSTISTMTITRTFTAVKRKRATGVTTAATTLQTTTNSAKLSTQLDFVKPTTTTTQSASGLANLLSQASTIVSKFCSCAETTPKAVTSTTSITSTVTASPSTITAVSIQTVTVTATVCGSEVCVNGCGCNFGVQSKQYGCYRDVVGGSFADCADSSLSNLECSANAQRDTCIQDSSGGYGCANKC